MAVQPDDGGGSRQRDVAVGGRGLVLAVAVVVRVGEAFLRAALGAVVAVAVVRGAARRRQGKDVEAVVRVRGERDGGGTVHACRAADRRLGVGEHQAYAEGGARAALGAV